MSTAFGKYAELLGAQAPSEACPVTGCRACGSQFFSVKESIVYKTVLGERGDLCMVDLADSEIDRVSCWDCFESHTESDFAEVLL